MISRVLRCVIVALVASLATVATARAQCACGPTSNFNPYDMSYRWESQNPVPLAGIQALASQAADRWNAEFQRLDLDASVSSGAGGIRIIVTNAISDGQASANVGEGYILVPEEWITRADPPFPNDYIMAVILHEMGHMQGFLQVTAGNCGGQSVMSDTNLSSYRTSFTNCDQQQFNYYWGGSTPSCHLQPPCGQDEYLGSDGCCYNNSGSPILIPLDSGAIKISPPSQGVLFDLKADGKPLRVAWPTGASVAWLALDLNGDGRITSGAELFGDATKLANGAKAANGFDALAEHDANGDGSIDVSDGIFTRLRLWTDMTRDGVGVESELQTLASAGIRAISVQYKMSERRDRSGNSLRYRAKVSAAHPPLERHAYDVYLLFTPQ